MAAINFKKPWEIEDEEFPTPPEGEEMTEELPKLEEEETQPDTPEEIPVEEPPEPESEPEPEPEPKKDQRPIARHLIPIHPDVAEELWGQPLTDDQYRELEEDWRLGFRRLTKAEREWYGISDDAETYANMESLSKNYLKVVGNQGKEDLIALELGAGEDGWPEGYLRDENGRFTDRCVAELLNMRDYTREYVLPREENGRTDLKKYKRGDLSPKRKLRILNEKYGMRFDYWEALRDRARRWREWREERDRAIPVVVEVNGEAAFGELITTPSTQAKVEQDISSAIQKLEQAEQLLCSIPEQLKEPMWQSLKPYFTKLGLELRSQGMTHTYDVVVSGKVEESDESIEPDESRSTSAD
jgi:hypothetical protein